MVIVLIVCLVGLATAQPLKSAVPATEQLAYVTTQKTTPIQYGYEPVSKDAYQFGYQAPDGELTKHVEDYSTYCYGDLTYYVQYSAGADGYRTQVICNHHLSGRPVIWNGPAGPGGPGGSPIDSEINPKLLQSLAAKPDTSQIQALIK